MTALSFDDVSIAYGAVPVVHGVSFNVARGECVGLVGESGCGKSTIALAAMRALPPGGAVTSGRIMIDGQDVSGLRGAALRELWSRKISMVYQDPGRALNPTMTIAAQMIEAFRILGETRAGARARSIEALARVRIADPARTMTAHPHQLSGGMQQRIVIAMALAKDPALLVLDEPTTGLDATVEAEILDLIDTLRQASGTAVLLISHNLAVVGRMADRIGVLYAGVLVEQGPAQQVLRAPRHPYTERLLRCLPGVGMRKYDGRLSTIPGQLPRLGALPQACVFAPRCNAAQPECEAVRPVPHGPDGHWARCHFDPPFAAPAEDAGSVEAVAMPERVVLAARDVSKTFGSGAGAVHAVRALSFELAAGETLGLVGESGSGKTTLARMLLGLVGADAGGVIELEGRAISPLLAGRSRADRKALQVVFQNPDSALNRAQTIRAILTRPLIRLAGLASVAASARAIQLADGVRLSAQQLTQRPRALSGGQKQRVAIARAFGGDPRVVICDEPTSALDVSVQAAILNLLVDLQRREQVSYVLISHDLKIVRYMADRIAVLYRGVLVEIGPSEAVFAGPNHPYTALLLAASAGDHERVPAGADAAVPDRGCIFQHHCPVKIGAICETVAPVLDAGVHGIRCHLSGSSPGA